MRANHYRMCLASVWLLAAMALSPDATAADAACDRACLDGFVDQYLAAHDPSRLPVTKTARYTGNGVTLQLGDGMWNPASFYGTLEEHSHPATLGLRLKIEDRRIGEMEFIVIRSTARSSFSAVQDLKDRPILNEPLAPSERAPTMSCEDQFATEGVTP